MAEVIELTAENFDSEVLDSDLPVLVDFGAEWCGPCKMIAPIVHNIAEKYAGRLKVCSADVDQMQSIAARYQVMSIPNLVFFKEGSPVEQVVGYMPESQLTAKVDSILG